MEWSWSSWPPWASIVEALGGFLSTRETPGGLEKKATTACIDKAVRSKRVKFHFLKG